MPVYDYLCEACGPFTEIRPMADYDLPHECPGCGADAPRVILTAPNFFGMAADRRLAAATNERSSHAPKTSSELKTHGAGCACCSGKGKLSRAVNRGRDGSKSFPTSRPWMISH